jgi:hypothetical protein
VPFGRNRESRSREAAGRRNWPEAVPREKERQKKAGAPNSVTLVIRVVLGERHREESQNGACVAVEKNG